MKAETEVLKVAYELADIDPATCANCECDADAEMLMHGKYLPHTWLGSMCWGCDCTNYAPYGGAK